MQKDIEILSSKETHPHIIVATPGRLNALVRDKKLRLGNIQRFVLDECDKMLDQIGMSLDFGTPLRNWLTLLKICDEMCKTSSGRRQHKSR